MEEKKNGHICCFKAASGALRRNTKSERQFRQLRNTLSKRKREREREIMVVASFPDSLPVAVNSL
jgi:hypothetical protein